MTDLHYGDRGDVKKIRSINTDTGPDIEVYWVRAMFLFTDENNNPCVIYDNGDREIISRGQWREGFKQETHG